MSSFLTPPSAPQVHVWQWDLEACDDDIEGYWNTLGAQERERAGKFRFDLHRRRFIAGRGELRRLLGHYLDVSPSDVAIGYGPDGKPYCTSQPRDWMLCFNLSHSENTAALAIANGIEIGIDIERIRVIEDTLPLDVFSSQERADYAATPQAEQQTVFFESWARKEACLKALGTGFILPPTHFEFDVSVHGDTTPRVVGGDVQEAAHWRVRTLSSVAGCAGAVAARRTDLSIVEMGALCLHPG
ncbi:4'-phosphopantetheinyl transferase superfamily protein [Paraburkholderia sp. C35]|uniref:4'-phosphopantetheinyl transferase family protein n=1 Tax=Paraburkholderia sp. C35 TaxID=2126993 RepID=UPI000D698485|nr:4'-phosphopantetheinyl transferase superfamily protein [Paraburkholderia sp. C35]